jgi:hypothetical protein
VIAVHVREAEQAIRWLGDAGAPCAVVIGEFGAGEVGIELR